MTVIACLQLAPTIADFEANASQATRAIAEAISNGARIIVLPELALSGYMLTPNEARSVAITPAHPVFDDWSKLVAPVGGVAIGGFAELGDDGAIYNSAAVVDGSGVLAIYRKLHLWDKEKLIFTPGSVLPPVVETQQGRLGILICYDVEFPEMTRSVALRGADLIAVPTNWARELMPAGEQAGVVIKAMAAASTNHVAIACCDRSGPERGQEWNELSMIVNERGRIVADAHENAVASADLDLTLAADKRMTPLADTFGDRRPEFYGTLTEPTA